MRTNSHLYISIAVFALLLPGQSSPVIANQVRIVDAQALCEANVCQIDVTLLHKDSGWDHYADSWYVVTEDGQEIGKRVLLHPHVNEQPFTRSLGNIKIPENTNTVWIEAHDSVHGRSERFQLDLFP